ncbi:hypothetical protein DLH72_03180 [Candidatus Gracilibacteria bacterium]|nr:MAG: hypothetical protein DLH72_03180 [Candidatus Gracilibacteria bacterium]
MKKIFIVFILISFLFSCSENFDSNIYKKVENENYSYLIPKDRNFEEGKYSKIITTSFPKENDFSGTLSIKRVSISESGNNFNDFFKMHENKKNHKETKNIKIDNIEAKRIVYEKNEAGAIKEVILALKGDIIHKIELFYLENFSKKEEMENIIKSIKFK